MSEAQKNTNTLDKTREETDPVNIVKLETAPSRNLQPWRRSLSRLQLRNPLRPPGANRKNLQKQKVEPEPMVSQPGELC